MKYVKCDMRLRTSRCAGRRSRCHHPLNSSFVTRISRTTVVSVAPCALLAGAFFFEASSLFAQAPDPTYWKDIRPVLRKHCTVCHSAKNLKNLDVSGGLGV